jgi:hypothetical protein
MLVAPGEGDVDPGLPGSAGDGFAHASSSDDRQPRAGGCVRGFPFQFSHRRYQTVVEFW